MEMIEAKERQERVMREAAAKKKERRIRRRGDTYQDNELEKNVRHANLNDDDCEDDSTSLSSSSSSTTLIVDLDPSLCGMGAFTGTCGTYAVREPMGLVVLHQHPNRRRNVQHHRQIPFAERNLSIDGDGPIEHDVILLHGLEMEKEEELANDEKKEQQTGDAIVTGSDTWALSTSNDHPREPRDYKEPFKIDEGQQVQVVSADDGVFQLARGAGFIVAAANQLVKGMSIYSADEEEGLFGFDNCVLFAHTVTHFSCFVSFSFGLLYWSVGGPLETSCKLEGMLLSVLKKKRVAQKNIAKIDALADGLRSKIQLELDQPEEIPVISTVPKPNIHVTIDPEPVQDGAFHSTTRLTATTPTGAEPSTPPKASHRHSSSPGQVQPCMSADSTSVELGLTPRTPGHPTGTFLEMEGNHKYINSPAHSCPMPSNAALDQPYIDSTPTGLPRYRVNSDEDLYGLGWAGALGCGSTLFGERLLEPSISGNDLLTLSFDENSLLNDPSTRSRAAALAAAAAAGTTGAFPQSGGSAGSNDSPIRSGGSFDGVNFRTGMSGHRGASAAPKRHRNIAASSVSMGRPRVRMMSEHRGIAAARNANGGAQGPAGSATTKRRTATDGFVG